MTVANAGQGILKFKEIRNRQYKVKVSINKLLKEKSLEKFEKNIECLKRNYANIYRYDKKQKKLIYTSETFIPSSNEKEKRRKLFFILGNPATHSIYNGMFFFSDKNGNRHKFWNKLHKAGLLINIYLNTRKEEANERIRIIGEGGTSNRFLVGFTTFYSFPTPVEGYFKDSAGVKKLFGERLLKRIKSEELKRIQSYNFAKNAVWVFTQKSSFEFAEAEAKRKKCLLYWPIRGKECSGEHLKELLKKRVKKKA